MRTQALAFSEFGQASEVLHFQEPDLANPESGEVLVKMLAAPINPSDLGTIGGSYGVLPELPGVGGLEGVGEVLEVGENAEGMEIGDWVMMPPDLGTWRSHAVCGVEKLEKVPGGLPVEQAAMGAINPLTAELLLEKLTKDGDWFVQNAANSAVGIAMIQIAKSKGIPSVNLVRRKELIEPMQALGADYVFLDEEEAVKKIRGLEAELGRPSHAFNSVGGQSAYRLAKMLRQGGQHITYGAMTSEPVRFPTRYLIFDDIQFSGFWVTRWRKNSPPDVVRSSQQKIYDYMKQGVLSLPVEATYPLADFAKALQHNARPRLGKILFVT